MNEKVHNLLLLFLYMAICSGFYYLMARVFVWVIGFLGRKTKGLFFLKVACFFGVWLMTSAIIVTPFFAVIGFGPRGDLAWTMLQAMLFLVSLFPAYHYVRKNMEVLYEAGYARRR